MLTVGFILALAFGAAVIHLTTDEQRHMIYGLALATVFLAWVFALATGIGPNNY